MGESELERVRKEIHDNETHNARRGGTLKKRSELDKDLRTLTDELLKLHVQFRTKQSKLNTLSKKIKTIRGYRNAFSDTEFETFKTIGKKRTGEMGTLLLGTFNAIKS